MRNKMEKSTLTTPLTGSDAGFTGKDTREDDRGRETALLRYILQFHVGMLGHEAFCLIDTVFGDELIEVTSVFGIDELTEIGSVKWQDLP